MDSSSKASPPSPSDILSDSDLEILTLPGPLESPKSTISSENSDNPASDAATQDSLTPTGTSDQGETATADPPKSDSTGSTVSLEESERSGSTVSLGLTDSSGKQPEHSPSGDIIHMNDSSYQESDLSKLQEGMLRENDLGPPALSNEPKMKYKTSGSTMSTLSDMGGELVRQNDSDEQSISPKVATADSAPDLEDEVPTMDSLLAVENSMMEAILDVMNEDEADFEDPLAAEDNYEDRIIADGFTDNACEEDMEPNSDASSLQDTTQPASDFRSRAMASCNTPDDGGVGENVGSEVGANDSSESDAERTPPSNEDSDEDMSDSRKLHKAEHVKVDRAGDFKAAPPPQNPTAGTVEVESQVDTIAEGSTPEKAVDEDTNTPAPLSNDQQAEDLQDITTQHKEPSAIRALNIRANKDDVPPLFTEVRPSPDRHPSPDHHSKPTTSNTMSTTATTINEVLMDIAPAEESKSADFSKTGTGSGGMATRDAAAASRNTSSDESKPAESAPWHDGIYDRATDLPLVVSFLLMAVLVYCAGRAEA